MDREPPAAGGSARVDRQRQRPAAGTLVGKRKPPVLDPVRAGDDCGQRKPLDRPGLVVPGQNRGEHRLPRPVGAAFGRHEDVDRRRRRPPGDAPVGEVEPGLGEAQKGEVLPRLGRHQCRLGSAAAAQQARIEPDVPLRVGHSLAKHVVVAGKQRHLDALARAGVRQAAEEDMQPVRAGQGRQPEIGHHEPLRRRGLPVLAGRRVGDACGQRVEPGLQPGDHVAHGQGRRHVAVQLLRKLAGPLPHRLAQGVAHAGFLAPRQRAAEVAVADHRRHVARPDPVEPERRLGGVDRHDRHRGLRALRQDVGAAGEADRGRPVAHIDFLLDRGAQPLAGGRRQPCAQRHLVAGCHARARRCRAAGPVPRPDRSRRRSGRNRRSRSQRLPAARRSRSTPAGSPPRNRPAGRPRESRRAPRRAPPRPRSPVPAPATRRGAARRGTPGPRPPPRARRRSAGRPRRPPRRYRPAGRR